MDPRRAIATKLFDMASQENCDGPEYDLVQDAAEYIRELEARVDFLEDEIFEYDLREAEGSI